MVLMKRYGAYNSISQMPVVLIPIEFDRPMSINNCQQDTTPMPCDEPVTTSSQHSVVLRTFLTKDFMTGRSAVPGETFPVQMLNEICQTIKANVPGISRILYDLTSKPPGRVKRMKKKNSILNFIFVF